MEKSIRGGFTRTLEERIQKAVAQTVTGNIEVIAHGQHGIGGRLWKAGRRTIADPGLWERRASGSGPWDFPTR